MNTTKEFKARERIVKKGVEEAGELEQHYRPIQVAKIMAISPPAVRKLFKGEPGVKYFSNPTPGKRAHITMLIPASAVRRVMDRMTTLHAAS